MNGQEFVQLLNTVAGLSDNQLTMLYVCVRDIRQSRASARAAERAARASAPPTTTDTKVSDVDRKTRQ